ncbi:GDP-mannose-dependent alpha-(1-6)-phosphatidylinositol monomannoside mannosyltransferase [Posidoniimonas polymericola]|uniref:GDP-mannose-dependent alpha-(1-6)-phosphatidylinositol monomannoside mannosyltransferase n=1 Tax=Posidoniimonas polymericola TaxID=2528002 RepID=A0A5C5YFG0_9BACT|nr:glycosyltransferase family 4 protein [Posidoniimonas polymericola]TWT73748.1 GDP-mannose-dependent alpha-(1-6)-phosphatidylinositol monomannoside mannosyltransferase [Posidoniimonas polymericola]
MSQITDVSGSAPTIRVTIVQPALAKYRIPVFRELAARPGIELKVVYGVTPGLDNVEADGFRAEPAGLKTTRLLGSKALVYPAQFWSASRQDCDVLMLTWTPRYVLLLPSIFRAKLAGVGVVLWGHGLSKSDRPFWKRARDFLARRADCLLFYDRATAQGYLDEGWSPQRISVASNAIDHAAIDRARDQWLSTPGRLDEFRRSKGLDGQRTVLFVSRLLPANRVDLLLEAAVDLRRQIPNIRIVIIGNGDTQRQSLQERAAELGIDDITIFERGLYNEEELAPWFLSADVFCYPENIGLSILHALWYGAPVVTSDRRDCHNPEIVYLEPGRNGECYRHGDAGSLSQTLGGLLANPARLEEMSANARESVEGTATVDRMVDGFEEAIRRAYEARNPEKKTRVNGGREA